MRNDLKGAEHQRVALQEPPRARQRAAVFRADGAGPNHVKVPRKRRVVKFRHDVQGDDLPARRLEGPAHRLGAAEKLQGVSAFLKSKITATATTKKTRVFIGPDFFPTDKKRSRAMKLALGLDVQTNAKGGKFMSIEDSRQGALVCKAVLVALVAEEALAQLGQPLQGAHKLLPPVSRRM